MCLLFPRHSGTQACVELFTEADLSFSETDNITDCSSVHRDESSVTVNIQEGDESTHDFHETFKVFTKVEETGFAQEA